MNIVKNLMKKYGELLGRLDWISGLSPESCPGGLPASDREWRDLVNRIVLEVRSFQREMVEMENPPAPGGGLLPEHGGYRKLLGFQVATIVYDGSRIFCDRFVPKRSRTHDQMVQAARSGRQNIAEGSMASATSKKTELKLTNVAKASLEELLLDFEDYLRQEKLPQWTKDSPAAMAVRRRYQGYPAGWFEDVAREIEAETARRSDLSDSSDKSDARPLLDPYGLATATPETAANTLICLIHQATYLLRRQLQNLEQTFLDQGGFTERLYRQRRGRRG